MDDFRIHDADTFTEVKDINQNPDGDVVTDVAVLFCLHSCTKTILNSQRVRKWFHPNLPVLRVVLHKVDCALLFIVLEFMTDLGTDPPRSTEPILSLGWILKSNNK